MESRRKIFSAKRCKVNSRTLILTVEQCSCYLGNYFVDEVYTHTLSMLYEQ